MKNTPNQENENNVHNNAILKETFCKRLTELRTIQNHTQKDIAEKLGCPVSTYANWEQGRTSPSIPDIYNLIKVFGIDANELFNTDDLV